MAVCVDAALKVCSFHRQFCFYSAWCEKQFFTSRQRNTYYPTKLLHTAVIKPTKIKEGSFDEAFSINAAFGTGRVNLVPLTALFSSPELWSCPNHSEDFQRVSTDAKGRSRCVSHQQESRWCRTAPGKRRRGVTPKPRRQKAGRETHEIGERAAALGGAPPSHPCPASRTLGLSLSAQYPFVTIIGGNPRFLPRTNIFPNRHRPRRNALEQRARSGHRRAPAAIPSVPSLPCPRPRPCRAERGSHSSGLCPWRAPCPWRDARLPGARAGAAEPAPE